MNNPAKKPTPRDREYLQAELTRMVGIGRIGLETFQQLVDTTLEAEDTAVLAQIHARYIGPPPPEWAPPTPQSPPQPPKNQLWPHPGAQAPPPQHPPQPPAPGPGAGPGPQYLPQSQPGQFSGPPPQPMQPFGQASPQQGYPPQHGYPAPPPQHLSSTVGSIKRTGQWLVAEHSSFRLNGATLDLDLREATAAGPVVTFEIKAIAATIKIVVPPGVHVTNHVKETWTESTLNVTAPTPGAPRVVLTGTARGCTLEVVTRSLGEKGFWEKLFGG